MKMYHNHKFNIVHEERIEPDIEDQEDINLFIVCMYFLAVILTGCLIVFIYQHF